MWRFMKNNLIVNEIFQSIDGEGKRAGELASFIRLSGCNLRCSYCDTQYAFSQGTKMSTDDIVKKIRYKNVTITGGEPLLQNIHELLKKLSGKNVNIETNGSIDIEPYFIHPNTWFTVDYKTNSSGMNDDMWLDNFKKMRPQDVVKFVVGNIDDLYQAKDICNEYRFICPIYISPVFGEIEPKRIVEFMKDEKMENWKIQLQVHKFIWNPATRGV